MPHVAGSEGPVHRVPDLAFTGIENFRDFGGFTGRHGNMRTGLLFRSGHHALASDEDLARLAGLNIATIIDLRRPAERAAQPSRRPPDFRGNVFASDEGPAEGPHVAFMAAGDLSDAAIERFLIDYYRAAPFEPAHRKLFAHAFAALSDGPLLIHCMQGKDRTGLLAALIQLALGADETVVMEEFLRTNDIMLTETRIARASAGLAAMTGKPPSMVALRGLLGVDARHLETALAAIRAAPGGMDAYLAGLGGDPARLTAAFRA